MSLSSGLKSGEVWMKAIASKLWFMDPSSKNKSLVYVWGKSWIEEDIWWMLTSTFHMELLAI